MLAVDVSFLAVPSVSVQNSQSVPVISTYISVFCIVGSMLVSLFLTRQNRQYGQESADKAVSSEWCADYDDQHTLAGRLPHEDDRICFWHKSSRYCAWSSLCYAIVGVSTLDIPDFPDLLKHGSPAAWSILCLRSLTRFSRLHPLLRSRPPGAHVAL
jgi:hypothetical protein